VVVVEAIDARARAAMALAGLLRPTEIVPVVLDIDPEQTQKAVDGWPGAGMSANLEVLAAPYREPGGPLRWKAKQLQGSGRPLVTIIEPAIVVPWWQRPLYRRQTRAIVSATATLPGVAVIALPLVLGEALETESGGRRRSPDAPKTSTGSR
jgi:hypothetical protein